MPASAEKPGDGVGVKFVLRSPDGEEGYPGNVTVEVSCVKRAKEKGKQDDSLECHFFRAPTYVYIDIYLLILYSLPSFPLLTLPGNLPSDSRQRPRNGLQGHYRCPHTARFDQSCLLEPGGGAETQGA